MVSLCSDGHFHTCLSKYNGLGWTDGYITLDLNSQSGAEGIQERNSCPTSNVPNFGCWLLSDGASELYKKVSTQKLGMIKDW